MTINLSQISPNNQVSSISGTRKVNSDLSFKGVDSIHKVSEAADKKAIPTKMLLTLMKSFITGKPADSSIFVGRTYEDWVNMYNMAHKNAVMPMTYAGIKQTDGIKVPEDVLQNMEINEKFAKRYHSRQEKVLKDFTEMTAAHGIDTVQMKGIGFSMNYPEPQKRFGGDIDVYNYVHGTNPADTKNNATFLVDKIIKKSGIELDTKSLKHSEFEYRSMPIENHRYFVNEEVAPLLKTVNKYLFKVLNPHEEVLPHGTKILVPSKEFNNLFIPFHAMQHYVGSGINFHHLADWAVQIQKNGLHIPDEIKGTKIEEFMYAFTNLANKHLGTNVKVPENQELENSIYRKMMHPETYDGIHEISDTKNPFKIFDYKVRRMIHRHKMHKEYWELQNSISTTFAKSLIQHLKHPKSIIKVFTKM